MDIPVNRLKHAINAKLAVRIPNLDPVLTKNLLDGGVRSLMCAVGDPL